MLKLVNYLVSVQ